LEIFNGGLGRLLYLFNLSMILWIISKFRVFFF